MRRGNEVRIQLIDENKYMIGVIQAIKEEELILHVGKETRVIALDDIAKLELVAEAKLVTDADFDNAYLIGKRVSIYKNGVLLESNAIIQLHEIDFIVVNGQCYEKNQYEVYTDLITST